MMKKLAKLSFTLKNYIKFIVRIIKKIKIIFFHLFIYLFKHLYKNKKLKNVEIILYII